MTLQIEVVSDVVCPWCFIGKRRLEEALRRRAADPQAGTVSVRWRPFQLNPDLPETGMARADYVARKFGDRAGQIYARVSDVGKSVGIDFDFERIARQPNTLAAHQLIAFAEAAVSTADGAGPQAGQDAMVERLFRGYFLEGADLTDTQVLLDLAQQAGFDRAAAAAALADRDQRWAMENDEQAARALGVEGVPFFIFNRRLAVSGAQEPEVLLQAMERVEAMALT